MNKAFTKEPDSDNDDDEEFEKPETLPKQFKNYMTPGGFSTLKAELHHLLDDERPKTVEQVRWAASNGDRSENADYHYNKKRLREIDWRLRYITKRLETAVIVDPKLQRNFNQVFFGATVTYLKKNVETHTITIVGIDEANLTEGKISWISPLASALMKTSVGDIVEFRTPAGIEQIEVLSVSYKSN